MRNYLRQFDPDHPNYVLRCMQVLIATAAGIFLLMIGARIGQPNCQEDEVWAWVDNDVRACVNYDSIPGLNVDWSSR